MVYLHACVLSCFSNVWLFATLQTVACQSPLSMGFCRQVYWSALPPPLPWYVYYTTNQENNYHQLLNFARAIARAHYSHKTLLSLGNFQWVQKTVRRKLFQNNQGIVYRWEYRTLRKMSCPTAVFIPPFSSVVLNIEPNELWHFTIAFSLGNLTSP